MYIHKPYYENCKRSLTHTQAHTDTHTHTHARTHVRTHARTHTHTLFRYFLFIFHMSFVCAHMIALPDHT